MRIKIKFSPHDDQKLFLENRKRFNVLPCGRRWGKSTLARYLLNDAMIVQRGIGFYYTPTSARYLDLWKRLSQEYYPLVNKGVVKVNSSRKELSRSPLNYVKMWSMEDRTSGRGSEVDTAIVDEAAFAAELEYHLNNIILATLIDRRGCLYIMSTPSGTNNYFYDLSRKHLTDENWHTHHAPTYKNPFIDRTELKLIQNSLPTVVYEQEYEAKFVDLDEDLFFYEHQKIIVEPTEINPYYPLWISFDFNVNPCTAVIGQKVDASYSNGGGCYIHDVIQVKGTTRELCKILKTETNYLNHPAGIKVTGDRTGMNYGTATDILVNNFEVIKNELLITQAQFVNIVGSNQHYHVSRNTCNSLMFNEVFYIDDKYGSELVNEITIAKVDDRGKLLKDRSYFKMDRVDAMRYLVYAWFPDGVPDITKFCQYLLTG